MASFTTFKMNVLIGTHDKVFTFLPNLKALLLQLEHLPNKKLWGGSEEKRERKCKIIIIPFFIH